MYLSLKDNLPSISSAHDGVLAEYRLKRFMSDSSSGPTTLAFRPRKSEEMVVLDAKKHMAARLFEIDRLLGNAAAATYLGTISYREFWRVAAVA